MSYPKINRNMQNLILTMIIALFIKITARKNYHAYQHEKKSVENTATQL